MEPKWLKWGKELQSIAQIGLTYTKDTFDVERFNRIREISVEILSEYTDLNHKKVTDLFCNESGYQTAKVDVRGAVFKDDKILLVREKSDKCWSMPGGWADYNLSIKENVIKELKEETGLNVEAKKLIAVLDKNKHHTKLSPYGIYKAFVHCDVISGVFEENIEIIESGYFDIDELPELSLDRITKSQIKMCFESVKNNIDITIFD